MPTVTRFFCNPNITHDGKMLVFDVFSQAGLIQIKDMCYEFIPGFFTSAIVEIIQRRFPDEKSTHNRLRF